MVNSNSRRPQWIEAASSAFALASALPVTLNSMQIADLFDKTENGQFENCPLSAEVTALRNASGESLLIVAAKVNNIEAVKHFAKDAELIDETDNEGWSPLLVAAHKGLGDVVRILLEHGATVDQPDLMGWSALMWAVYKSHVDVVDHLLQYRAHVNLIDEEDGLTPLIVGSGRGFSAIVNRLIDNEAQVNACDKFGSTALIWAARKGHLPVVESLLNAGAGLDAVGMYSSTALMLATKGNYYPVVDVILKRDPNVNVTDQHGLSALGMAAREGYAAICEALVNAGAYVNQCDRFGNWILTSAVRSGNIHIVKLLLDKFADVNCKDSDQRTPLHLAIDKSFIDMAQMIIERKPSLDTKNKDGETPLIRAVKCRHVALVMMLRRSGARLAPADNNGDNALHIALRARSRRLAQALLENAPIAEKRLLYRPNKVGQTAYSIDQENPQPILPLLYGPKQADKELDSMLGFDVYGNVLADIVCEPSLSLPLTVGLYAKWGSGKSVLLAKLKDSMNSFSRNWTEGASLRFSYLVVFYLFIICLILTNTGSTIAAIFQSINALIVVWVIGGTFFIMCVVAYVLIYYGSEIRNWQNTISISSRLARIFAHIRLFWNVVTLHAPLQCEADTASNPVSFLFADYHRLSSIGGEQALAKIITTLIEAAEVHYGSIPVRLYCALKMTKSGQHGTLRRQIGVPIVLLFGIAFICLVTAQAILTVWLFSERSPDYTPHLALAGFFFALFAVMSFYPAYVITRYCWTNEHKRRVNKAARRINVLKFEGLMHALQSEVDVLTNMIRSLDAFTRSQTRMVVTVDGLDNCEQERMVQTLDAIDLLFSSRQDRPIISIIAVDPHIIITAINHNIQSALAGTELTGYDYLKNIINMPFFLHNSALRQLQNKLKDKRESLAEWKERWKRQETFHGSVLSLDGRQSRKATVVAASTRNLGEQLTDDYFTNLNPRAIRRIINSLTLSGRLMRAFEIDFSWLALGHWISLLEQWPVRMCWLIDRALDVSNPNVSLAEIYVQLKDYIPKKDALIDMDRNANNFEAFLTMASIPGTDQLTVSHVKKFVPCTSNLDPYLRKLIRERRQGEDETSTLGFGLAALPPNAKFLFPEEKAWAKIDTALVEMHLEDVVAALRRLDIHKDRLDMIVGKFQQLNLTGLVLASCPLQDLRESLQINLGDWTMVRLLIETLRAFGHNVPGVRSNKKKSGTLREEDEEGKEGEEDFEELTPRNTIIRAGSTAGQIEQRRRSAVMSTELNGGHQWLMQGLSNMDLVETEGDRDLDDLCSSTPSVRFDDDVYEEATDGDSVESRLGSRTGSRDNLLDPANVVLSRHSTSNDRSELMHGVHNDSIHSFGEPALSSRSSLLSDGADDHQQTVMKRGDNNRDDKDRAILKNLFSRSNDSQP